MSIYVSDYFSVGVDEEIEQLNNYQVRSVSSTSLIFLYYN